MINTFKKPFLSWILSNALSYECDSIVLYQLEWLRIQSLIGQKKYNEVRESLEQYRLQEGDYRDKADSLWMLLR